MSQKMEKGIENGKAKENGKVKRKQKCERKWKREKKTSGDCFRFISSSIYKKNFSLFYYN